MMNYYGPLKLDDYATVKSQVVTIYQYLRLRSMLISNSGDECWPEWALEILRNWANTGCRETQKDPVIEKIVIPASNEPLPTFRVRKDVMSLTDAEALEYRIKLDDILGAREKDSK